MQEQEKGPTGSTMDYRRFKAFLRAPAVLAGAARLTGLVATADAAGAGVTFESAIPRGAGDVSLSVLLLVSMQMDAVIVFADTWRGPEDTGLMFVMVAVTVDEPFDTGLDDVGAHDSEEDGVSNSGGGTYMKSVNH